MMLSGIGNYFLIVGGWVDPLSAERAAVPLIVSVMLQAAIFVACVVVLWPRRADRRLRAIAIVFLGTLGAGQVDLAIAWFFFFFFLSPSSCTRGLPKSGTPHPVSA